MMVAVFVACVAIGAASVAAILLAGGPPSADDDAIVPTAFSRRERQTARRRAREPDPLGAMIDDAMARARLPVTLSRSQITGAMAAIKGRVAACYSRHRVPGLALVQGAICGGSGRLEGISISGAFAGTPTGACVQEAARGARFPRFSGPPIRINFPFRLR
jgi:hypothetical protein